MSAIASGYDILDAIVDELPIAGVIGLVGDVDVSAVSGYLDGRPWCDRNGIEYVGVTSYQLSDARERSMIAALDIDLLLVLGWQRLIPRWLIEHSRLGAIGVHGSSHGIAGGRGRSPQNWALILGDHEFHLSIFRIDERVDSGGVIATRSFPLTAFDDIKSSYYKTGITTAAMLVDAFRSGRLAAGDGDPQSDEALYLPQRTPEDGGIDWRRNTAEIHGFVRSLTRPYPGAATSFAGASVTIWSARPFAMPPETFAAAVPGEVVRAFAQGDLLVRTGDGILLIEDYEFAGGKGVEIAKGTTFTSSDHLAQMEAIASRHEARYPNAPLHPDILAQAGRVLR